jgi:hypothetical protein
MIFEFSNLVSVFIMNVCQLIPHVLIFSNQKVPVVFQLARYVVKILYFPLCLRQFLLYAQLLLLLHLCALIYLLVLLL